MITIIDTKRAKTDFWREKYQKNKKHKIQDIQIQKTKLMEYFPEKQQFRIWTYGIIHIWFRHASKKYL